VTHAGRHRLAVTVTDASGNRRTLRRSFRVRRPARAHRR
jgi:hypothetical protein